MATSGTTHDRCTPELFAQRLMLITISVSQIARFFTDRIPAVD
jgi:hypothetical protein